MHVLISADKMPFERGSTGLKMSLPDGKIIIREVDR